MRIKPLATSAIAAASVFGMGCIAFAAVVDLDIYGSSSMYPYWNAIASTVLSDAGCTPASIQQATYNNKNTITRATCGADTVHYRVSSKASFDGILALKGNDSYAAAGATNEKCSAGDAGDPGPALRPYYRKMVDEASCVWGTPSAPGTCTSLKCVPVTLGASDVAGESFTQSSSGQLKGPLGGGLVTRSFAGISTTGFTSYNPIVVPFAFFANTSIKKDLAYPKGGGAHVANWQTITNLSRMKTVMIYSGQAWDWTDFGADYISIPIVACLRHAGSGAHAALDNAVMHGTWGAAPAVGESATSPTVYFNDGSDDEVNCISGSGTWTGAGAIGYADSDHATTATMVRLTYNGEAATRENIRNGSYDFFTKAWMYEDPAAANYAKTHPYVLSIMTTAGNPAKVPASMADYWATTAEMVYMKTNDWLYPAYVGATSQMLP